MNQDLIRRARASLAGKGRIRSAYLRRAVSDAYYALFHKLAQSNADQFVGTSKRNSEPWFRVYRGLNHGTARQVFELMIREGNSIFTPIATAFINLQKARHDADYNPKNTITRRADAEAYIQTVEDAIKNIDTLTPDAAMYLASLLLINKRS